MKTVIDYNAIRFRTLRERVDIIKKKLREKERDDFEKRRKAENTTRTAISSLKIAPKNEITYNSIFSRNPFDPKKNMEKLNFSKHKIAIEMANRNIKKNRIEFAVKQVALHYTKAKSRLHIDDGDMVNELRSKINRKLLNQKGSGNSTKYYTSKNRTEIYKETDEDYEQDQTNRVTTEISQIQNNETMRNQTQRITRNQTRAQSKNNNTSRSSFPFRRPTAENTINVSSREKQERTSIDPILIQNQIQTQTQVINKPIYTTSESEFAKEYRRLNNKLNKERQKFISYGLLSRDEIDSLMESRTEMKMLNLRHRFVSSIFKPKTFKESVKKQKERFIFNLTKKIGKIGNNYNDEDD